MFKLTEFTEAHVASVTNRQETNGNEKVPAVSLGLRITAANYLLDTIDPLLRLALFKSKDESAASLPGVEESTPVLRCNSIESVELPTKHEGWTMQVDFTGNEDESMTFGSCKVDRFVVTPKQGGSIELALRVGTSDLDPAGERLGALGMHNGQSIWVKLLPPLVAPKAIDGSTEAFQKDHPGASGQADLLDTEAGDAFSAEHGTGTGGPDEEHTDDDGSGHPDTDGAPGVGSSDEQLGKDWPFPRDGTEGAAGGPDPGTGETMGADPEPPKPRARRGRRAAEVE